MKNKRKGKAIKFKYRTPMPGMNPHEYLLWIYKQLNNQAGVKSLMRSLAEK